MLRRKQKIQSSINKKKFFFWIMYRIGYWYISQYGGCYVLLVIIIMEHGTQQNISATSVAFLFETNHYILGMKCKYSTPGL